MKLCANKFVLDAYTSNNSKFDSWSLFFDKFTAVEHNNKFIVSEKLNPSIKKEETWKKRSLDKVINSYNFSKKTLEQKLEQKYLFFKKMAKQKNMKILYFENTSRLLVNMGHSLVLENVGLSFERISGIPCIPGSALKGVVSNWALWEANGDAVFETVYNSKSKQEEANIKIKRSELSSELTHIFGGNEGDEVQGKINFYGIFPMEVPKLGIDIITPHQDRIVPNHFLAIDPGTIWYVPISYNRAYDEEMLLNKTENLIESCLKTYGIGSKVASGYGRFDFPHPKRLKEIQDFFNSVLDEESNKKAEEKARLERQEIEKKRIESLDPEELAAEVFENSLIDKVNELKGFMSKISDLQEKDQRSVCILLNKKYSELWIETNKNPNKKAKKRIEAVKSVAERLGVEL